MEALHQEKPICHLPPLGANGQDINMENLLACQKSNFELIKMVVQAEQIIQGARGSVEKL
jgi:primosomal replication protein N